MKILIACEESHVMGMEINTDGAECWTGSALPGKTSIKKKSPSRTEGEKKKFLQCYYTGNG